MKTNCSSSKQHRILLSNPLRVHPSGNWQETDVVGWVEELLRRTQEEILHRDGCQRPEQTKRSAAAEHAKSAVS